MAKREKYRRGRFMGQDRWNYNKDLSRCVSRIKT